MCVLKIYARKTCRVTAAEPVSAATVASVASSNRQWCAGTVQAAGRVSVGEPDGLVVVGRNVGFPVELVGA